MMTGRKCVIAAVAMVLAVGVCAGPGKVVVESARRIPVAYEVDVVVVGGSTGAVAAAAQAARAGASVFLAAERTYLGEDVCGTHRLWDTEGEPATELGKRLFAGRPLVTPMQVKQELEAELLDAGVEFLYGCFATDVLRDGRGDIAGIVMANRAGRQAVRARVVVDATGRATVARLAGADFSAYGPGEHLFRRVVIGGEPGVTAEGVTVRQLPELVWSGDELFEAYEYTLAIEMADAGYGAFAQAEQVARDLTWRQGQLKASEMLFEVPPDHIRAKKPHAGGWAGVRALDLDAFRPAGLEQLYVLGGCADVRPEAAEHMLQPLALLELGERIGRAAAQEATGVSEMRGVRVAGTKAAGTIEPGEVREVLAGARPMQELPTVASAARTLEVLGEYDVVVVGGGTGGAPAAIAAARRGAGTLVIEYQYGLGGVGTIGMINRYSSTYVDGFTGEIDRGVVEMGGRSFWENTQRPLWDGECKMEWYRRELRKAGGELWLGVLGCGAVVDQGKVKGVVVAGPLGRGVVLAGVVIDATGNADVAAAAGAQCVYTDAAHVAVQGTGLPAYDLDERYINTDYTFVDDADMVDAWRTFVGARRRFADKFDLATLIDTRERRRIVGDFTISPLDFLNRRTYPDTVFLSEALFDTHGFTVHEVFAFPISFHGRFRCYGPYRSLLPQGLRGMLVTGLGISAHRDAMSVYRMQPDIQNQGYAAGVAAAMAVQARCELREIDLRALREHLVEMGNLPAQALEFEDSFPIGPEKVAAAVASVVEKTSRGGPGYKGIEVILAQPELSLPLLREAYQGAETPETRLVYAHVLAMMGDPTGLAELVEAVRARQWDKGWSFRGLGQWGASLSPLDSLIIAMGRTGDERVVAPTVEKLSQLGPESELSHHRAVALALERFHDPQGAQRLAELLGKDGMSGYAITDIGAVTTHLQGESADMERDRTLRELILARALYRCGDHEGVGEAILRQYAGDLRGHYRRHALAVLAERAQGAVIRPDH